MYKIYYLIWRYGIVARRFLEFVCKRVSFNILSLYFLYPMLQLQYAQQQKNVAFYPVPRGSDLWINFDVHGASR